MTTEALPPTWPPIHGSAIGCASVQTASLRSVRESPIRSGRAHGAGAGGRRGTRRRRGPHRDDRGDHRSKPRRGFDRRQPFHPAFGRCASAGVRGSPRRVHRDRRDKLAVPKEASRSKMGRSPLRTARPPATGSWPTTPYWIGPNWRRGPKPVSAYQVVGTSVARLDLPDKLAGLPRYVHDLTLVGMVYGRVVRPPSRGATLREIDTGPTEALPGVIAVVHDGLPCGRGRTRGGRAASCRPAAPRRGLGAATDTARRGRIARVPHIGADGYHRGGCLSGNGSAPASPLIRRVLPSPLPRTRLDRPLLRCRAPGDDRLEIWTHSQGVHVLRREIARVLEIPQDHLVVRHVDGSGCYGHTVPTRSDGRRGTRPRRTGPTGAGGVVTTR